MEDFTERDLHSKNYIFSIIPLVCFLSSLYTVKSYMLMTGLSNQSPCFRLSLSHSHLCSMTDKSILQKSVYIL